jgi:hypothetical protein
MPAAADITKKKLLTTEVYESSSRSSRTAESAAFPHRPGARFFRRRPFLAHGPHQFVYAANAHQINALKIMNAHF